MAAQHPGTPLQPYGAFPLSWQRLSLSSQRAAAAWKVFASDRLATAGLALLLLFGVMPILRAMLLGTVWPEAIYDTETGFDPLILHPSGPSPGHLLGTDAVGRDVFSMLLASAVPAFVIGLMAAATTAVLSTGIGAVSAVYGRRVDSFFNNLSNAFLLLPAPLVMVILAAGFQRELGPFEFGAIYGLLMGFGGASVVMRSRAIEAIQKAYIDAARVAGAGGLQVLVRHVLPEIAPLAAAYTLVTVTGAIVSDGFASFFSLNRGYINWGSMVYAGIYYRAINATIPWNMLIAPGLALSLFAAAFYMVSRGVHKVADPRLREGEARGPA